MKETVLYGIPKGETERYMEELLLTNATPHMKVKANHDYIYYPNLLDRVEGRTKLVPGDIVRVVNLPGAPKANTMGHAHVQLDGKFAGLVSTNSLYPTSDAKIVVDAIKADMAAKSEK